MHRRIWTYIRILYCVDEETPFLDDQFETESTIAYAKSLCSKSFSSSSTLSFEWDVKILNRGIQPYFVKVNNVVITLKVSCKEGDMLILDAALSDGDKVILKFCTNGGKMKDTSKIYSAPLDDEFDFKDLFMRKHHHLTDTLFNLKSDHKGKLQIQDGQFVQTKSIDFFSPKEANSFDRTFQYLKKLLRDRTYRRIQKYYNGTEITSYFSTSSTYVVEILSARNLIIGDYTNSDPYCVVRIGFKVIHRTKPIYYSLDPIWTIRKDSVFLLSDVNRCLMEEGTTNITFEVWDKDKLKPDDFLGYVAVPFEQLLNSNGRRIEIDLDHVTPGLRQGKLAFICELASKFDIEFLKYGKHYLDHTLGNEGYRMPNYYSLPKLNEKILTVETLKTKKKKINGETVHLVRPYPDPEINVKQQWMTTRELKRASLEPSRKWIEAGGGGPGCMFLEVLGCEISSTNKSRLGHLVHPFVTAVFEDTVISTNVIIGSNSPIFLPWSRRAFKLNIRSTSSELNLAVFDQDISNANNFVGRVSVSLLTLSPNTEYILNYKLYNSSRIEPREERGTIKIRLVLENTQNNNGSPKTPILVNSKNSASHELAELTIMGESTVNSFQTKVLYSYKDEFKGYLFGDMYRTYNTLKDVLSWRRPVHSLILFLSGVLVLDYPHYIPTIFFGLIAWVMLSLSYHQQKKSVWERPLSFFGVLKIHLFGSTAPVRIDPIEIGEDEMRDSDVSQGKKKSEVNSSFGSNAPITIDPVVSQVEEVKIEKKKPNEISTVDYYNNKLNSTMMFVQEYLMNIDSINLTGHKEATKKGLVAMINPLEEYVKYLKLMQDIGGFIVNVMRYLRNLFSWRIPNTAFRITSISIFFSVLSIFIPWKFVCLWFARFIVYICLSPVMGILSLMMRHRSLDSIIALEEQVLREKRAKYVDMSKYFFGKYVTSKPFLFPFERFDDYPMPNSSAKPMTKKMSDQVEITDRVLSSSFQFTNINPNISSLLSKN